MIALQSYATISLAPGMQPYADVGDAMHMVHAATQLDGPGQQQGREMVAIGLSQMPAALLFDGTLPQLLQEDEASGSSPTGATFNE